MAAIAPIAVQDGKSPAVTHTLNPVSTVGTTAIWRDSIAGLSTNGQVSLQLSRQTVTKDLDKVRIVLSAPALEVTSGSNAQGYSAAPKVAYEVKADLVIFLPSRALPAQNKDLRTMLSNLLLNNQVWDVIDNGVMPY